MRKPQDPRMHGLQEPRTVHNKTLHLVFGAPLSLESLIKGWNKALKDHESQGHRIVNGPNISNSYGQDVKLYYTIEWDNLAYDTEKSEYDATITTYLEQLSAFTRREEEEKNNPPNLDKKIEKTKRRLANLEATRDGQPLPFPE